jgi:hypothetical protein
MWFLYLNTGDITIQSQNKNENSFDLQEKIDKQSVLDFCKA